MALAPELDHLMRTIADAVLVAGGAFIALFPRTVRSWCYRIELARGKDKGDMREQIFNRWYNHPAVYSALGLLSAAIGLGMLTGFIDTHTRTAPVAPQPPRHQGSVPAPPSH